MPFTNVCMQAMRPATRHRRPLAPAVVVRGDRGIQSGVALRFAHQRVAADLDLAHVARYRVACADRRQHGFTGAVPYEHLAADQETALVNGGGETLLHRNVVECGEVLSESRVVVGRHEVSEGVGDIKAVVANQNVQGALRIQAAGTPAHAWLAFIGS